jgi:hypothetical protein
MKASLSSQDESDKQTRHRRWLRFGLLALSPFAIAVAAILILGFWPGLRFDWSLKTPFPEPLGLIRRLEFASYPQSVPTVDCFHLTFGFGRLSWATWPRDVPHGGVKGFDFYTVTGTRHWSWWGEDIKVEVKVRTP